MHGLMMDQPLLISDLIRHADRNHGDTEIVSKTVEGGIHRYTYREAHARARRLARALQALGTNTADRVGTSPGTATGTTSSTTRSRALARSSYDQPAALCRADRLHLEPRREPGALFRRDVHAARREARAAARHRAALRSAHRSRAHAEGVEVPLLRRAAGTAERRLPVASFDERTAALCYTSGTTGNPKGALYQHRSTVIHAYAAALPDALDLRSTASCRWCRCSTPMPGACPTRARWSARRWCFPGRTSTARASTT